MVLEACWLHLCGVNAVESTTSCYGELFVDLALVAAASVLFRAMLHNPSIQGFLEFSLLYFSILNGWYLYAHHLASRFPETSHIHWLPVGIFLCALCLGINYASYDHAREFSQSMMVLRMAAFFMMARVASQITRAGPMCALLGFLTSDAILCFAIAASDEMMAPYLWCFAAMIELVSDLVLTVGLSGSLVISHNIQATMDRAWVLVLAPLGATILWVATNTQCCSSSRTMGDPLLLVASLILQLLFCLLYFDLQTAACSHVASQSQLHQAVLLILTKLLGWALWTAGACLLVLLTSGSSSTTTPVVTTPFIHVLLGWSVGGSLILFLGLRLFGGRPHDRLETVWAFSCWTPFIIVSLVPPSRPLVAICIYLILLSLLNILEAWSNLGLSSREQQQQQLEQQQQQQDAGSERERLLP
jgi:hypothetical protein